MNNIFKKVPLIFYLVICACGRTEVKSPFETLLIQAPYAALSDSIRQAPENDQLFFRRGILLRQNQQIPPALSDFEKAWSLRKKEEYAATISAMLLEQNPDSATTFIKTALITIPKSIFLKLDLARAYRVLNQKDQALLVCNEITSKTPGQIDALIMQAELLEEKKDTTAALASLEKAYSMAPFDVELNYALAFKYAQSRNTKTLSLCDSLLKMDARHAHAEPLYFKGVYYSNINAKEKALDFFNQAIHADYNFLDAYLDKGRTLYELRKINEALKVFTLASTVSPAYADAYYWMGKCLQANGEKEEARENYQRAYGLDKTLTESKDSADKIKL